jgi:hypothetical protein
MRPIGFESRLIELSNGSRITSIGVRTKPGHAREVGKKIYLDKGNWIDPLKESGSIHSRENNEQAILDRSTLEWIDPLKENQ